MLLLRRDDRLRTLPTLVRERHVGGIIGLADLARQDRFQSQKAGLLAIEQRHGLGADVSADIAAEDEASALDAPSRSKAPHAA